MLQFEIEPESFVSICLDDHPEVSEILDTLEYEVLGGAMQFWYSRYVLAEGLLAFLTDEDGMISTSEAKDALIKLCQEVGDGTICFYTSGF